MRRIRHESSLLFMQRSQMSKNKMREVAKDVMPWRGGR